MGLLEIGRVGRPHGLRGEVAVDLVTNRTERLDPGSRLVAVAVGTSTELPLEVTASQAHGGRYLVAFAGVADRTAAERLTNATLYAEPAEREDVDELFVHELIGARLVDLAGVEHGVVTSVEANPASDLLVTDAGALVPVRFVTSLADGVVTIDPPEGLFE